MRCQKCKHENPAGSRFCLDCGVPLGLRCATCDAELPIDARFCNACGGPISQPPSAESGRQETPGSYTPKHLAEKILASRSALEGEHKLVTVLFCDIANSTAMAEKLGPEAMHALLNQFFGVALAEVHRYEGTINQFLGDGFMALFGAPVAHEDHAKRAVLSALDIQDAIAHRVPLLDQLQVRMGLNTGPVVVGTIGDDLRMDYSAVGDTTNLAARLQQHAEPGTIMMSEGTHRLVQGCVETGPLPAFHVKGKSEPVIGFTILGRGAQRSPLEGEKPGLSPFVGRKRESTVLGEILSEVRAGHGQAVGIVGEPGVGKSRLLYQFRQGLGKDTVTYLEGRCVSYGGAIPYLPVLDVLRSECELSEADSHEMTTTKISSTLRELSIDDESLPYLLALVGVKQAAETLREITPETIKARTFQALLHMALAASRRWPLVLAIEDLHWVDKTSEEFLAAVAENLAGVPIMLLATYRPGYRSPWMDQSYATQIALRPLSAEDSRTVVTSALASAKLADDLAQSIVIKGDGNPFFLEELARSVLQHGTDRGHQDLPETIQAVLLARIDRLRETAKRLLQSAAVLGREAPLSLLRETSGAPETLDADLHELKWQEFLYEKTDGREPMFVFTHVLTQEAAYRSLLRPRLEALHEAAGWALERLYTDRLEEQYDLLAYHYSRSANSERAFAYLVGANRKCIGASALVEAKGYFERAMELLDRLPDTEANRRRRVSLLSDQIIMFQNLFQMSEYYGLLRRFEPVANDLGDPALLGPFIQQIGHCDWTFGRFEEARRRFAEAGALCEKTGNYAVLAQTYQISMWNYLCLGEFHEALNLIERAELAWIKHPDLRWYVYALCAAALAYAYLGRFDEAVSIGHKALAVTEEFEDTAQMSFAAWSVAFAYLCRGDLLRALQYGTMGVEKAPTPAERAWAQGALAAVWCRSGQADKAIEILAPVYANLRAGQFIPGERFALFLGESYWRAGQHDRAKKAIEEGLEIQTRHNMRYEAAVSHRLLGELAASMNSPTRAEAHFLQSIAMLEQIGALNDMALACAGYGRSKVTQGNVVEARKYLARAVEVFERLGTQRELEQVRAELSAL
jgi:class 3 adenylate cyclase/tetratricopeptide (TPR) repeat protein